jgi:hypothetical protein
MDVLWLFIQSFRIRLIVTLEDEVKVNLKSNNNEDLNQNI